MQDNIKLLLKTSSEITTETSYKKVLIKFSNVTKKILNAQRCSIFLHDKKNKELYTYIAHGVKRIHIKENNGIVGASFLNNEILNISNVYNDKRSDRSFDKKNNFITKSILTHPLRTREGKVFGVFQVTNKIGRESFTKEDCEFLRYISGYVSEILENQKLNKDIRKAQEEIIYRLSFVTRYKDPETQNHIIRVGLYCSVLAKALGWSRKKVELIRLAAPMHDIGKVGIPDRILLKPTTLDDEEWSVMKKHTEYGHKILKGSTSKLMKIAALVALEHHEKWNGKGYPMGKKREEISIYARMLSLVDVFDALSSKRHYKNSWPTEETLSLIKSERGKQFDPQLVDLFLENLNEILKIRERYGD